MVLAGDSQCFWSLSAFLSQFKTMVFFFLNRFFLTRSISATLAAQISVAANISEYVTTKRCEACLVHASFVLPDNLE